MIGEPINDRGCLARLTEYAVTRVGRADVAAFAARFESTRALVRGIRALPQRDDLGDPKDGPRVTCDVTQRARIGASDPNCVERALLYVVAAEHLDPRPLRQLVTIETPAGRHTLPVEDGVPVILDPRRGRNAIDAAVWRAMQRGISAAPSSVRRDDRKLLEWIARIATEPAIKHAGELGLRRVSRAGGFLRAIGAIGKLPRLARSPQVQHDLAYTLDLASVAAPLWGPAGVTGVEIARTALSALGVLPRRNALMPNARPIALDDLDAWAKRFASAPDAATAAASQPREEKEPA